MSLTIYTNRARVPNNIPIIDNNESFFNHISLSKTETESFILDYIDSAKYLDRSHVSGKFSTCYPISELSTGCKTLLNILNTKDRCFNVVECGNNALECLFSITDGYILLEMPAIMYSLDTEICDVIYNNKHYNNVYDVLVALEEGVLNGI